MCACVCVLMHSYVELGEYETAAKYFAQSYANIHPPFNVWLENPTNGAPNFITGAGGFMQGVAFGYGKQARARANRSRCAGRIRLQDALLSLDPVLPPNVSGVKLRYVTFFGCSFDLHWDDSSFTIEPQTPCALQLTTVNGNYPIKQSSVKSKLGPATITPLGASLRFN
jgi:hypothetical protein